MLKTLAVTVTLIAAAPLFAAAAPLFAADAPATRPATRPAAAADVDQAAREAAFADKLTDAVMVGSFTAGKGGEPREDRYTLIRAVKGDGDEWAITTRVEYKGFAVPMTISVPVKWAGDTPVISVTNQKIPGFGTFTARVMFYGDRYAGTWEGAGHGGLMWGHIEKAPATRPATVPAGR